MEIGLPTFLDLRSADVVHSFWVPRLMGKIDLVPNKVNSMWIEPERTGVVSWPVRHVLRHPTRARCCYASTCTPRGLRSLGGSSKSKPPKTTHPWPPGGGFSSERLASIATSMARSGNGRFGPDLTHLMSREHARFRRAEQFSPRPARVDQIPRAVQTGSADAGDESQRRRLWINWWLTSRPSNEWHERYGEIQAGRLPLPGEPSDKTVLSTCIRGW